MRSKASVKRRPIDVGVLSILLVAMAAAFMSSCTGESEQQYGGEGSVFLPTANTTRSCSARDAETLQACASGLRSGQYDEIVIESMIACNGPRACLIDLNGLANKTIRGRADWSTGFFRSSNYEYAIISVGLKGNASGIVIRDLVFDEDANQPDLFGQWAAPIKIMDGRDIKVDHIRIVHFHDVAMWVNSVDGFSLSNSELADGHHLGLVIGVVNLPADDGWGPSNRVIVNNNRFYRAGLNGLVVEGVRGTSYGQNVFKDNVFNDNHFRGLYSDCGGVSGNICGGGMVYVRDGDYLTFERNTIIHGYCDNCNLSAPLGVPHEVRGFELDGRLTDRNGYEKHLRNVRFVENEIHNLTGSAFYHNYCPNDGCAGWNYGPLDKIEIRNNRMFANRYGLTPPGEFGALVGTNIVTSGNAILNRKQTWSYEDWSGRWNTWADCTDWSVHPFSGDPLHGKVSLRLRAGAGCTSVCARSNPAIPVGPRGTVVVANWARNGAWKGTNSLVFLDQQFKPVSQVNVQLLPDAWAFNGEPVLVVQAPEGARYVTAQFCLNSANASIDHDLTAVAY